MSTTKKAPAQQNGSLVSNINISLVVHIVIETLVVGVVTYWLHNKYSKLSTEVEEMKRIILQQQQAIQSILGGTPLPPQPQKKKKKYTSRSSSEESLSEESSDEDSEKLKPKKKGKNK
jgi:hypothetical protein